MKRFAVLCLGAAAVAAGVLAFSPRSDPAHPALASGKDLPVLSEVPEFALSDASGNTVRREDLSGPWAAAFIFTRCSGLCPIMTERMKKLSQRLPALTLVSFSVDPEDDAARLRRFSRRHAAGWTFLTGAPGEVQRLSVEGFKLAAAVGDAGTSGAGGTAPAVEGKGPDKPITHSSYLTLVDERNRIRGYYDALDPEAIERLARDAASLEAPPKT